MKIFISYSHKQGDWMRKIYLTRYTVSPAGRNELLARLLKVNHRRAAAEAANVSGVKITNLVANQDVQVKKGIRTIN
jgi:hypothetical protein